MKRNNRCWDVYVDFAPHVATLTTKQVKKVLKQGYISLASTSGKGWAAFVPRRQDHLLSKGNRGNWRVEASELSIVKVGHDPETGLPYEE